MARTKIPGKSQQYVTFASGDCADARLESDECSVCDGETIIFERDEQGYGIVTECPRCSGLKRRIELFRGARLPARYHDRTFENFRQYSDEDLQEPLGNLPQVAARVLRTATDFLPGDRGLLLVGEVGTGKTHLLSALVRHLTLEKGFSCRFMEFTHLLSELREAYERKEQAASIVERLASVSVLAIDELGKGRKTDWQLQVIDELISKRYNRCLSTFFTSNYPIHPSSGRAGSSPSDFVDTERSQFRKSMVAETLGDRVGQSIVSRIHEMATMVAIKDVPDFRRRTR